MTLLFITGNQNKFREANEILGGIEQLDIDLPEIQDFDAHPIIAAKLRSAFEHRDGPFIVEDTSLYLDCMNGLPGPLIKWFLERLGAFGLADLVQRHPSNRAEARTIIGYAERPDEPMFFEGSIRGTIVLPRGETGFGWDPIFLPDGHLKTFAEMDASEKNSLSMRRIALMKLQDYLTKIQSLED